MSNILQIPDCLVLVSIAICNKLSKFSSNNLFHSRDVTIFMYYKIPPQWKTLYESLLFKSQLIKLHWVSVIEVYTAVLTCIEFHFAGLAG